MTHHRNIFTIFVFSFFCASLMAMEVDETSQSDAVSKRQRMQGRQIEEKEEEEKWNQYVKQTVGSASKEEIARVYERSKNRRRAIAYTLYAGLSKHPCSIMYLMDTQDMPKEEKATLMSRKKNDRLLPHELADHIAHLTVTDPETLCKYIEIDRFRVHTPRQPQYTNVYFVRCLEGFDYDLEDMVDPIIANCAYEIFANFETDENGNVYFYNEHDIRINGCTWWVRFYDSTGKVYAYKKLEPEQKLRIPNPPMSVRLNLIYGRYDPTMGYFRITPPTILR